MFGDFRGMMNTQTEGTVTPEPSHDESTARGMHTETGTAVPQRRYSSTAFADQQQFYGATAHMAQEDSFRVRCGAGKGKQKGKK